MNKILMLCLACFCMWTNSIAAQTVFSESFDGTTTPTDWTQTAVTGGPWAFSTGAGYDVTSTLDHSDNGGNYAWVDFTGTDDSVSIETPGIDVSTLTTPNLQFYYESHYTATTTLNVYNILYILAWDGTTWLQVDRLQGNTAYGWDAMNYDLTGFTYSGGDSVKVRFVAQGGGDVNDYYNDLLIDDVKVMERPSCISPSLIMESNATANSVDISWTQAGAPLGYGIEYGPTGFAQGTGTLVTALSNPYTLTGLMGDTDYDFYLAAVCSPIDTSTIVGAYAFTTLISCPVPTALTAANTTTNSADLGFTENGTATQWEVEYDVAGFALGSGTRMIINSNPETITGLMAGSTYGFYVRAICGAGDTSTWSTVRTFATSCATSYTPTYSESFATFLNPCWSEAKGRLNTSTVLTGTTSFWDGDGFGNVGTTGAARVNIYTTNRNEWLVSPSIDLGTGATSYQLEFDVILTNYNNTAPDLMGVDDSFAIVISTDNGATWSTSNILRLWDVNDQPSNTGDAIVLDLTGYTGVVKFGFYAASSVSNTDYDVSIDNFVVTNLASCAAPTTPSSSTVTENSATLNWTENGTASNWAIEYGPLGFTPGTGTTVFASTNPTTVTGLTNNTSYQYYVRAVCGMNDTSTASNASTAFTTLLAPLTCATGSQSFVYSEDFEGGFPAGWNQVASTDPDWTWDGTGGTSSLGTGPSAAQSGTGFMYLETTGGSAGQADTLTSPSIDLTSANSAARLLFQYHMYGADIGTLSVEVSDDGGATWTSIWSQTGQQQTSDSDPWLIASPDMTPYTGSMVMLRFIGTKGTGGLGYEGDMAIDLVQVQACVSCAAPSAINTTNLTARSVDLSWTANGPATNFFVEYGIAGAAPTMSVVTTSNPLNITGLTPETDYSFYVTTICGPGDSSITVGPINARTLISCPAPTALMALNITTTSVDLSWTENGTATNWELEYGAPGFVQGTGTTTSVLTNPTTLTGLTAGTAYAYYVRAACGAGDSSAWVGPLVFTTNCLPFTATYTQNFDGAPAVDPFDGIPCWRIAGPGAADIELTASTDDTQTIPSAPNAIELNDGDISNGDSAIIVSPQFSDLPSGANRIRFMAHMENTATSNTDIALYIGTMSDATDAATFVVYDSFTNAELLAQAGFQMYTIDLDNQTLIGTNEYIAFMHGEGIYEVYIDDFTYEPKPAAVFEDVAASAYIGLDSVYCSASVTLSGQLVITNNTAVDAANVPYTITVDGFPVLTNTITLLAGNSSDTITVGPLPVTPGSYDIAAFTSYMADSLITNDTISTTIVVSNTTASIASSTNTSCNGTADGMATAMGSNGVPGYNYMWSDGTMGATLMNAAAGTYTVVVTDTVGCVDSTTTVISEPAVLSTINTATNVDCNANATGGVDLTVSGGTPNYTFVWSDGSTMEDASGLMAGAYYVTVTDANGCMAVDSATVTQPAALVVSTNQDSSGNATSIVTGGTTPYAYLWDDNNAQNTATATGLQNGTYTVVVTDANNCQDSATINVVVIGVESLASVASLNMFPNPTTANVFVQLDLVQTADVTVQVMTVTGQSVLTKVVGAMQSELIELPTANLATGVYLVQMNIGDEQVTRKLIITRN